MSLLGPISAALIDNSVRAEYVKQRRFQLFRKMIGALDNSLTNLSLAKISFYDPRGSLMAFADKQVLGCWDSKSKEWTWAWSMMDVPTDLKMDAKRLFWVGHRNRWPLFVTPKFKATSHIMRVLCALSQKYTDSWYCVSYKSGTKHWYVLMKNMQYLDPLVRMSLDQQLKLVVSPKRRATKRKSTKRKSTKRKSTSRKSTSRSTRSRKPKRRTKRKAKSKAKRRSKRR